MSETVNMNLVASLDVREIEDRGTLMAILGKNGYVVSHGRRKSPTGKSYIYTIEVYSKQGEKENGN